MVKISKNRCIMGSLSQQFTTNVHIWNQANIKIVNGQYHLNFVCQFYVQTTFQNSSFVEKKKHRHTKHFLACCCLVLGTTPTKAISHLFMLFRKACWSKHNSADRFHQTPHCNLKINGADMKNIYIRFRSIPMRELLPLKENSPSRQQTGIVPDTDDAYCEGLFWCNTSKLLEGVAGGGQVVFLFSLLKLILRSRCRWI